MKTTKLICTIVCALGLVASAFAQNVESKKSPGILGYLDPKTGAFHVLTRSVGPEETPQVTPTTGKFVFNITIAVNPGLPSTSKISCTASVAVEEAATVSLFEDNGAAAATRSGSTATCSITLPYGWYLTTPTTDMVTLNIQVASVTGKVGTLPYSDGLSSQTLSIKVPASGSTTTETISTAI
jgi:hypothetical protein